MWPFPHTALGAQEAPAPALAPLLLKCGLSVQHPVVVCLTWAHLCHAATARASRPHCSLPVTLLITPVLGLVLGLDV